jgi:hypothetical protein
VLVKLARYWNKYPDLRLGQLVTNAADKAVDGNVHDVFYIEDDKMEAGLDRLLWTLDSSS